MHPMLLPRETHARAKASDRKKGRGAQSTASSGALRMRNPEERRLGKSECFKRSLRRYKWKPVFVGGRRWMCQLELEYLECHEKAGLLPA